MHQTHLGRGRTEPPSVALDRLRDDGDPEASANDMDEPDVHDDETDVWAAAVRRIDLRDQMEENPFGTILLAVGVGFVASGALMSRFSVRLFSFALRAALIPLVERRLGQALRADDDHRRSQ